MHIGIAGPIATENVSQFLSGRTGSLPRGYLGAPILATLIAELLRRGHTVSAFTTSGDVQPSIQKWVSAEGERFRIHYCGARRHAFRPCHGMLGRAVDFFATERACLSRAIRHAAPDVIHAHWSYEFGLAAIASGLPHVVTCHDAPQAVLRYMPNLYRLVRYWMGKKCLRHARVVTAVSPYMQQAIASYVGVPVSLVPNPLPEHVWRHPFGSGSRSDDTAGPVVAMVLNGWCRLKNPEPAFRAFHLLRQELPFARMHVYGSDFAPGQIAEAWARSNGLAEGISFRGPVGFIHLLEELKQADVLLHPSLEESFGMSAAEAMALGVPVVGGKTSGGVPWVVGDGGVLTDVTSPELLLDALLDVVADRERHFRYAKAARRRAEDNFTVRSVADQYEQQYHRCLKAASLAVP